MASIDNVKTDTFEGNIGERIPEADPIDGLLKKSAGFLKPYVRPFIPLSQKKFMSSLLRLGNRNEAIILTPQVQRTGGATGFSPLTRDRNTNSSFKDLAKFANDIRAVSEKELIIQEFVYINGVRLPGIFKGINFLGGIKSREFDKQRTQLKINGVRVSESTRVFQVDYGDKPITGTANFEMMDDSSSAKLKSQQFVNMITNDELGDVFERDKIPRVFTMESYMNGPGMEGPLQFKRIKIINWGVGLPTGGSQGVIPCFFQFEQFEILSTETKKGRVIGKKETAKTKPAPLNVFESNTINAVEEIQTGPVSPFDIFN